MESDPKTSDRERLRRLFLLKDAAKTVAVFLLTAAVGCYVASGAGSNIRAWSVAVGVISLAIGLWAFWSTYSCPKCRCRMKVQKLPGNSAPLHLVCEKCETSIDLRTPDSNP